VYQVVYLNVHLGIEHAISLSLDRSATAYPECSYIHRMRQSFCLCSLSMCFYFTCVVVNLQHLKYLSVAGCPNIDDWCLDRFVQFRDTLLVLDLSRCPRVTERGLASLHKLRSVECCINNLYSLLCSLVAE